MQPGVSSLGTLPLATGVGGEGLTKAIVDAIDFNVSALLTKGAQAGTASAITAVIEIAAAAEYDIVVSGSDSINVTQG